MQWRRQALRPLLAELKKDFSRQVQEAREPLPLLSSSSRGPPAQCRPVCPDAPNKWQTSSVFRCSSTWCVCVCVCMYMYICMYVYIYIYIYMYVCVCVRVRVQAFILMTLRHESLEKTISFDT